MKKKWLKSTGSRQDLDPDPFFSDAGSRWAGSTTHAWDNTEDLRQDQGFTRRLGGVGAEPDVEGAHPQQQGLGENMA